VAQRRCPKLSRRGIAQRCDARGSAQPRPVHRCPSLTFDMAWLLFPLPPPRQAFSSDTPDTSSCDALRRDSDCDTICPGCAASVCSPCRQVASSFCSRCSATFPSPCLPLYAPPPAPFGSDARRRMLLSFEAALPWIDVTPRRSATPGSLPVDFSRPLPQLCVLFLLASPPPSTVFDRCALDSDGAQQPSVRYAFKWVAQRMSPSDGG
jgi:hypothetical protein